MTVCKFVEGVLGDISRGEYYQPQLFAGTLDGLSRYDYGRGGELIWSISIVDMIFWESVRAKRRVNDVETPVTLTRLEKRLLKSAIRDVEKRLKEDIKRLRVEARDW